MGVLGARLHWVFLAAALLFLPFLRIHADGDTETKVKAAFIVNFVPFVKWPPETLSSAAEPFTICVEAAPPLEDALEAAARNKFLDEHPFVVRKFRKGAEVQSCQIAFFAGNATVTGAAGVLTIADNSAIAGASEAGVIVFVLQSNRVRFAISNRVAEHAGLAISSKLLALATQVDR